MITKDIVFQKINFNYADFLLEKLNSEFDFSESLNDGFDIKKVKGGYSSSKLYILHNGPRKKIFATAFHIPRHDSGKIHHYDIKFFRFCRKNQKSLWQQENFEILLGEEKEKLKEMINEQDSFIGLSSGKKYSKVIANSDSGEALQNYKKSIDLLSNAGINFDVLVDDDINKVGQIIKNIMDGKNVLLKKEVYAKFLSSRFNKTKIIDYEKNLIDYNNLLSQSSTTETDMQNFLNDKVWFFGLNYSQCHQKSKPKFSSGLGSEYDFLLEGFNQVYDIAELKGPNELLFDAEKEAERKSSFNNRIDYKFSNKFSRALHQVMSYMDEFESNFEHLKQSQPSIKSFMYPKGTIVISKRDLFPQNGKNSNKYLHLINRQFANIDILTYDDLADRAKIIIDFIKKIV